MEDRKMRVVTIEARRSDYNAEAAASRRSGMTVSELIDLLEGFDGDMPVIISNDSGYTFGSIEPGDICQMETDNND